MIGRLVFLGAEIKRELIMQRRYLLNTIMFVLINYILFMGIYLGIKSFGRGPDLGSGPAELMLGYLLWMYAAGGLNSMGDQLAGMATRGCLEQVYLAPVSPLYILACKSAADVISGSLQVIPIMLAVILTTGIKVSIPILPSLLIWGLTIIGLYGFGYILAGIVLVHKRAGQARELLQWFFFFFCGVIVPLEKLPPWLQPVSRILPLTQGLDMIRALIIRGEALSQMGDKLFLLFLNSMLYLLIGMAVFLWSNRIVQQRGTLSIY